ncbi:Mu transposase C-terminal domain-containing protein [Deinococcus aerolatus]|nr:Mu transposase C-terminal domain-containing protein [Deinococcus aerolatus]
MTQPPLLRAGNIIRLNDQSWRIDEILSSGHAILSALGGIGAKQVRPLSDLDISPEKSVSLIAANDTPAKRGRLDLKWQFQDLYSQMTAHVIPDAVTVAGRAVGIARSTAYTWWRQWMTDAPLVKEYRSDVHRSRMPAEIEALMQEVITAAHALNQPRSRKRAYHDLQNKLSSLGLRNISYATFCRRVGDRPVLERMKPQRGRKAQDQLRPTKKGEVGAGPLDLVEVDHWMIDMILLADHDRRPVGVAYLTLLLDTATRVVLGYYLSFDPPNQYAVGRALYSAFQPKTEVLHRLGIQGEWPCWGVPKRLRPDNAAEFKSRLLQDLSLKYRFSLTPARPYRPRDKAKIEAFFGTLSRYVKDLPGSTKALPGGRQDGAREATRTLRELETELIDYIVNGYHRSIHETLQSTPLKAYQTSPHPEPVYSPNREALLVDVLPQLTVGRKVHPFGVLVHNIQYWNDSLIPLIGRSEKYIIKYDPYDLSSVWLLQGKAYIRLRYKDLGYPRLTLREYKQTRKAMRAAGHDPSDTDSVMGFYRRSEERSAESRAATQATRRSVTTEPQTKLEQPPERPTAADKQTWLAAPLLLEED